MFDLSEKLFENIAKKDKLHIIEELNKSQKREASLLFMNALKDEDPEDFN
jgi:hypothetical protein